MMKSRNFLRHGGDWLASHPEREEIAKRYLKYRRDLAKDALARLVDEETPDPDVAAGEYTTARKRLSSRDVNLNEQRLNSVLLRCSRV